MTSRSFGIGIAFSIGAIVKDYIQTFMPKDLQNLLDLNTLKLDNRSFINEEFQNFTADLVYTCHFKSSRPSQKLLGKVANSHSENISQPQQSKNKQGEKWQSWCLFLSIKAIRQIGYTFN